MTDLSPAAETRSNRPELTVTELSAALKRTVEEAFGYVRVRGEVSNYRGPHSSGHAYFCLKDEGARIDAVIWRGVFGRMRIKPEEGLEVVATGRLTTFPGSSKYQIVIESLEPAGVGALMALLEQRKRQLGAEGLFDEARKQLLPYLPLVIGVVTSPTGAVIRDILHRLEDRFPRHVVVWPVRVQGEGAAAEVAAAIAGFNALPPRGPVPRPDLLIVARGGGSLEDLWAFNEEVVVRAAAESMIPLISAVGHETDVTLIDFAADKRAPTPTAAAEMAVPVRAELLAEVEDLGRRQHASWRRGMDSRRTELRAAARALPRADELLDVPRQRLDAAGERLPRALRANAQMHRTHFSRVAARLTPTTLRTQVHRRRDNLDSLAARARRATAVLQHRRKDRYEAAVKRLGAAVRANAEAHKVRLRRDRERVADLFGRAARAIHRRTERCTDTLARAGQLLAALSHRAVLARGFALVRDADGTLVRSAAAVSPAMRLDIEFADGHAAAVADGDTASRPASTPPVIKPRSRRGGGDTGQGSLFGA